MVGQSPAVHEDVDGMDKHQQSEESQTNVHLKHSVIHYLSAVPLHKCFLFLNEFKEHVGNQFSYSEISTRS